jgi:hypothetical protein
MVFFLSVIVNFLVLKRGKQWLSRAESFSSLFLYYIYVLFYYVNILKVSALYLFVLFQQKLFIYTKRYESKKKNTPISSSFASYHIRQIVAKPNHLLFN